MDDEKSPQSYMSRFTWRTKMKTLKIVLIFATLYLAASTETLAQSEEYLTDEKQLEEAIAETFRTRGTDIPDDIMAFSDSFVNAKAVQWNAFRRKLKQETIPADFAEIVFTIKKFLRPIIESIRSKRTHGERRKRGTS